MKGEKRRCRNGCRIYVDIITGEKLSSFRLQFPLAFIGQAVYPVIGEGVKGGDTGYRYFSPLESSLIIEHENLV